MWQAREFDVGEYKPQSADKVQACKCELEAQLAKLEPSFSTLAKSQSSRGRNGSLQIQAPALSESQQSVHDTPQAEIATDTKERCYKSV